MIMKEILIPAVATLAICGFPILVMLADIIITLLEKPRWALTK